MSHGARKVGPVRVVDLRRLPRALPDLRDADAGIEERAGRDRSPEVAAADQLHARHVARRVEDRRPRPADAQQRVRRVVVTVGVVVTSLLAAYAFAFLDFPGKGPTFVCFLATLLVPTELTVVVNQRTVDSLGWINSYQGLIVPLLATTFGTFLVRQVFLTVPKELREAAALDGVGHFRFLWEVAVPLCRPTLGALALFTFLGTWNQYLWPSAIITDDAHRTIQIGLERLKTGDIDKLNLVTAGTVIAALPIFVMLVAFQRQLVRGLTAGAVKG